MVNSGPLNGLPVEKAIATAIRWLGENGLGEKAASYHLRDWIFSRQHYWGEPIPMIFCAQHGWVPVPEDQLPVLLPEVERYLAYGYGRIAAGEYHRLDQHHLPGVFGPGAPRNRYHAQLGRKRLVFLALLRPA